MENSHQAVDQDGVRHNGLIQAGQAILQAFHPDLSVVSQPGDDAESAARAIASPMERWS